MSEIEFIIGDHSAILENPDILKHKTLSKLAFIRCDIGPKTPEYIVIRENGKEVLRVRFLFKIGEVFIGWRV